MHISHLIMMKMIIAFINFYKCTILETRERQVFIYDFNDLMFFMSCWRQLIWMMKIMSHRIQNAELKWNTNWRMKNKVEDWNVEWRRHILYKNLSDDNHENTLFLWGGKWWVLNIWTLYFPAGPFLGYHLWTWTRTWQFETGICLVWITEARLMCKIQL